MAFRTWFRFGPATLVAAAFIGPGTVVTASMAGAQFGYALLWALVFAIAATMVLQEMAARVGVVTGAGLGEALRNVVKHPSLKVGFIGLVVAAVVIGNSAFQGGNLTGASMGAQGIWQDTAWVAWFRQQLGLNPWALIIGLLAIAILWGGYYQRIEKILIGLVVLMSLAFITTFVLTRPDLTAMARGLVLPAIPSGGALTTMALIGTTVVPYALFLHAASAAKRWPQRHPQSTDIVRAHLQQARADTRTSIPLGGLVTLAILSSAAAAFFNQPGTITGAADLARGLEPVFGVAATYLMAIGLLAAGVSSAVTAPLASAYALTGVMGWSSDMRGWPFRLTWLSIIIVGMVIASLGVQPVTLIMFAQVANGILLPFITGFLLLAVNHRQMGVFANHRWQNVRGGIVLVIAIALGARSIWLALGA
ncbi:Nramp family divalent metal transporter [Aliidiomarina maris]|uniref:Manganese transporter n=1 Tax=Aliidiomarina maris TaxID=531312 RepID=A0A327X218_9GAMM|nr:Nramp family divalent metal transporter [Aliidiomarina maris]RAK00591.1 NRAMP (natural resistance-associated macrophage protein)-like metal ion transporter [Aliidiomarina maris]RUO27396.1 manganese transporter [Aliidiomarina maris]